MRNLKRVLSLALAMIMVLGLMVISSSAASADFDDVAEIDYVEAVDVLSALGIIKGDGNDVFNPNGILNREGAAKIICYMLMGPDNAEKLVGTNVFTDVAADRWSAGYISYCASLGIIAGNGDGTFNPNGKLTGVAFAKLLLVALGYDPVIEGYVGDNWATNIAVDALEAGITIDGVSLSAPLTREQACQMALQTLTANMVKYQSKGTTVTVNGVEIVTGASSAEPVTRDESTSGTNYAGDTGSAGYGYQQFCEKYFSGLKKADADSDAFGRPADYKWTLTANRNTDTIYTANEAPVLTSTSAVTGGALYTALGKVTPETLVIIRNGVEAGSDSTETQLGQIASGNKVTFDYTGEGVLTQVYYDAATKTATVVEVLTYLGTISDFTAAKLDSDDEVTEKAYITVELANNVTKNFETTEFSKADKGATVLCTYIGNGSYKNPGELKSVKLAASIEDIALDKYVEGTSVTFGGDTYKYSSTASVSEDAYDFDSTYTVYFDTYGNVISVKTYVDNSVSKDYAFVVAIQDSAEKEGTTNLMGTTTGASVNAAKAQIILTDGTKTIVDLALTKSGETYTYTTPWEEEETTTVGTNNKDEAEPVGAWVAYTVDEDGAYSFTDIDSNYAAVATASVELKKGETTEINSKYTNSHTTVVYVDTDGTVTTSTGLPTADRTLTGSDGQILYTYAKGGSVVSAIYAVEQEKITSEGTTATYAYALKKGAVTSSGVEWTFAINGEAVTYAVKSGVTVEADGIYDLTVSTKNIVTAANLITDDDKATGTIALVDDTFLVLKGDNSVVYYYATGFAVYNVENKAVSSDTLEKGDTVTLVLKDGKALIAYITESAE